MDIHILNILVENIKNNFHDADQSADHSVKKKSKKALHQKDLLRDTSNDSSSVVGTISDDSSSDDSDFIKSHDKTKKKVKSASSDGHSILVESTISFGDKERKTAESSSESSSVDDED